MGGRSARCASSETPQVKIQRIWAGQRHKYQESRTHRESIFVTVAQSYVLVGRKTKN